MGVGLWLYVHVGLGPVGVKHQMLQPPQEKNQPANTVAMRRRAMLAWDCDAY